MELFDDDGYPTDEALDALDNFEGTAAGFVDAATAFFSSYGNVTVEDTENPWWHARKRVSFVTGGWSGNEAVTSVIDRSMFHHSFWRASHRGGLTVYEVPENMWESDGKWGGGFLVEARRTHTLERIRRELDRLTATGEADRYKHQVLDAELSGGYEWWQILAALDNA